MAWDTNPGAEEIEQDLVIILPPNRQYVADVKIVSWHHPRLLIDPDDSPDGLACPSALCLSDHCHSSTGRPFYRPPILR